MEIGYCVVGDGNKQEWEQVVCLDWFGIINKFGQCWYSQCWMYNQNFDCQIDNCINFQEGREVIMWCEQQLDWQYCCDKIIFYQYSGKLYVSKIKVWCSGWVCCYLFVGNNSENKKYQFND